jgi:hypothetical protein
VLSGSDCIHSSDTCHPCVQLPALSFADAMYEHSYKLIVVASSSHSPYGIEGYKRFGERERGLRTVDIYLEVAFSDLCDFGKRRCRSDYKNGEEIF